MHTTGRRREEALLAIPVPQSPVQTFEQALVAEWLAEKPARSCCQRTRANPLVGESRDEDDRRTVSRGRQPVLQLDAAQTGHLHVGDQAGCVGDVLRTQEFLGRRECRSRVTKRPYKPFGRLANRSSSSTIETMGTFNAAFIVCNHCYWNYPGTPWDLDEAYMPGCRTRLLVRPRQRLVIRRQLRARGRTAPPTPPPRRVGNWRLAPPSSTARRLFSTIGASPTSRLSNRFSAGGGGKRVAFDREEPSLSSPSGHGSSGSGRRRRRR